jgi:hypothetical protein
MWAPLMGFCLLLCFLIKDRVLTRPGEEKMVEEQQDTTVRERSGEMESETELQGQLSTVGEFSSEKSDCETCNMSLSQRSIKHLYLVLTLLSL